MKKTGTSLKKPPGPDKADALRGALLGWYDRNKRVLPWRYQTGEAADPYIVWLSEIMLQQTTVAAVIPYFLKFTSLWPDVFALAAADINDVMREWAGLGYYARARNMHKCAQVVAAERGGVFPQDQKELMSLPGIGEYTSAAIRAIAFGKPATVVDGNVERVMARVHGLSGDTKAIKKEAKAFARTYFEGYKDRPGDLAQAFMDLGATVCIPKAPRCFECPLGEGCLSRDLKLQGVKMPVIRTPKEPKETREGLVFWVQDEEGRILLQRRAPQGLLGGVVGLPTSRWEPNVRESPFLMFLESLKPVEIKSPVKHSFTHFQIILQLRTVNLGGDVQVPESYFWCEAGQVGSVGLPSLFNKAYRIFLPDGQGQH